MKREAKLKLGKRVGSDYEYSTKIDFKEELSAQITALIKEKKIRDALGAKIEKLREVVGRFSNQNKDKNLEYYYSTGRLLLFLDERKFKDVAPYSVYRRIVEEVPSVLPHIRSAKVAQKHLETMHGLAHLRKTDLRKASWDQWYEIFKFRNIHKKPRLLSRILRECKKGLSGIALRERAKNLIRSQ